MLRKDFLRTIKNLKGAEKYNTILTALENGSIENEKLFKTRVKNIFINDVDSDIFDKNVIGAYLEKKNINSNDMQFLLSSTSGQDTKEAEAYIIAENIKKQAKAELEKGYFKSQYNSKLKEIFNNFKIDNDDKKTLFDFISDYLFSAKGKQVKNDGVKAVFSCIACIKNDGDDNGFTWIYREFITDVDGSKAENYDQAVQIQTEKPVLTIKDLYKNNLENLIGILEKMREYTENYKNLNNLTFNQFRNEQFEKLEKVRNSNIVELERMLKEYKRYSIEF